MAPTPELIRQLAEFDTALLANTIGRIDPTPAAAFYMESGIATVTPALGPTVGVAVTCECDTSTPEGAADDGPFWELADLMSKTPVPTVLVAKVVGSRPNHECVAGDGTCKILAGAGCVGLVTDGGVRDVEGIMTIPFAVYSRGRTIHHTALRFRRVNQPIEIGGITVSPGEVIHANIGGVIKIPTACLERLPERAVAMRALESELHFIWRQPGVSAAEKRRAAGPILKKYGF